MRDDRGRHRVHRLVHEQSHRGPAGRSRGASTASTSTVKRAMVVPGSRRGEAPSRAGRPRQDLPRRGVRLARGGLLDVPRDEPRQAGAAGALRVDLEPQLRGTPGPRRPHPPRLPRRRRSHRRRRHVRHSGGPAMKAVRAITGTAVPLDRSDVDTDQIIPSDWLKRVERTGFGKGLFSEWRDDRVVRPQRRAVRGRIDPRRRPELRHGLVARARGVGDHGLRLRGRDLAALRRHLPQQLHEERPRAGAGAGRLRRPHCSRAVEADPTLERHGRRRAAHRVGARDRARDVVPARSRDASSASSKASTTSASRCATRTTSRPSKPSARVAAYRCVVLTHCVDRAHHGLQRGREDARVHADAPAGLTVRARRSRRTRLRARRHPALTACSE